MTFTRRILLKNSANACLAAPFVSFASNFLTHNMDRKDASMRCINVINFIRAVEPRETMDLILPVQKQMEVILEHRLPATWLLQFDALVSGPFVAFLKEHMAKNHEVGFWFEMNEMHCKAADVEWRGRPGFEWDSHPSVAFTIGYTPAERIKLVDAAMKQFRATFGKYPCSVASWNLDAISIAHLSDTYGVDAFAVCRDQIATDGFTIWGAPIAGYYPSKVNCWSPALDRSEQIHTPIFRMLGQDPVYYYQRQYTTPDGRKIGEPDTMEPVWFSGRSKGFVNSFLNMIAEEPCLDFAYAQLGQENSFGWAQMEPGYGAQMAALAALRDSGAVHVETMSDSGRRFKKSFAVTPPQAQVQLQDPFGNTHPAQKSIWYQSRFYRANLHLMGDLAFLRDLTVYSDKIPQPFLKEATRLHEVEQRMPAVVDGYHWSQHPGLQDENSAGGFFRFGGELVRLAGEPRVTEDGSALLVELPLDGGDALHIRFGEKELSAKLASGKNIFLSVNFQWDKTKAPLPALTTSSVQYLSGDNAYKIKAVDGHVEPIPTGWKVTGSKDGLRLALAQA
jgi:hypothetical protein